MIQYFYHLILSILITLVITQVSIKMHFGHYTKKNEFMIGFKKTLKLEWKIFNINLVHSFVEAFFYA